MANPFISSMLITENTEDVIEFYREVFDGWTLEDPATPRDWVKIDCGGGPGGIIMNQKFDDEPLAWLPCVQVEDIDDTLERVDNNQGETVLGREPMPDGNGDYAIIADPKGAKIAIRQLG